METSSWVSQQNNYLQSYSRNMQLYNYHYRPRGYKAMVNHEAKKSRMKKGDRLHAWFMTSCIVPPDDIDTDEELNDPAARPFKGRRVIRRKVSPSSNDYERFLSKF